MQINAVDAADHVYEKTRGELASHFKEYLKEPVHGINDPNYFDNHFDRILESITQFNPINPVNYIGRALANQSTPRSNSLPQPSKSTAEMRTLARTPMFQRARRTQQSPISRNQLVRNSLKKEDMNSQLMTATPYSTSESPRRYKKE